MFITKFLMVSALTVSASHGFASDGIALPPGAVGEMPEAPRPQEIAPLQCTPDINSWGHSSACSCPSDYSYSPKRGVCLLGKSTPFEAGLFGAAPTKGSCSNSSGTLELVVDSYEGGMAPPPGMEVYSAQLFSNGKDLGSIVRYETGQGFGEPIPKDKMWDLRAELPRDSVRLIDSQSSPYFSHRVFSAKLKVETKGGSQFEHWVICEEDHQYMLP